MKSMKSAITIWSITFASAFFPMLAWYAFDAYVLGNCDIKFGCFGRVQIGSFVIGVSAFISSSSVLVAFNVVNKIVGIVFSSATIVTSVVVGIILGVFTEIVLPNLGETSLGLVNWLVLSFIVGGIAYLLQINITRRCS